MKQTLIFLIAFFAYNTAFSQPSVWGATKIKFENGDTSYIRTAAHFKDYVASYFSGGGTVSTVSVATANGLAGTSDGNAANPTLTLTTSVTGMLKGNGTAISAATAGTDYSAGTGSLATGILKSTTSTGNLSIAVAGDFPTLNQNTTGSAATLTTPRAIYGNNFDGSAALTQVIASTYGGTGNGFAKFSGPATSEKTFTLPNASATILTDNAVVTVAQGGTGRSTSTTAYGLIAAGTTATGAHQTLAAGATTEILVGGGASALPVWTTATGSGAPVRATSPTLVTPLLGTPTSGTLTNCTGLPLTTGVTGVLPVANGGLNLSSVGSDNTFLASNGTAYYPATMVITTSAAAISVARSGTDINFNLPNADASNRGTVSPSSQTFGGAKTFNDLLTGSGGITGTATSSNASVYENGVPARKYTAITANTTLDHTYNLVGIGTLSADITITLPACDATNNQHWYSFTKLGSDNFSVTIDPNSTETFTDNAPTKTIFGQNNSFSCQCVSASAKWTVGR